MEFMTGGVLEFWSLDNPDSARGRKYRRIVVDEAALIPNLFNVWNFSLRPMLVDYTGDAFFLSTPRGLNGFWQLWQLGQDERNHEWRSWKMPTTANPHIPASEVEAMRLTMPERVFAQEVLADFIDDAGGVFRRVREAATAKGRRETLNNTYVMGVDWGKHNDFTVITTIDIDQMEMVQMDRFNQIDYAVQVGRLKAICEHWKPIAVVVERNSIGEPLIENLIRDGLPVQPFTTTNASKAQIIDGLALAFERNQLRILDDEVLINELLAYDMERLPSGLLRYGAPDGFHDDCVVSLALAYYGSSRGGDTGILNEAFSGW